VTGWALLIWHLGEQRTVSNFLFSIPAEGNSSTGRIHSHQEATSENAKRPAIARLITGR
jgi:hypothetical protein